MRWGPIVWGFCAVMATSVACQVSMGSESETSKEYNTYSNAYSAWSHECRSDDVSQLPFARVSCDFGVCLQVEGGRLPQPWCVREARPAWRTLQLIALEVPASFANRHNAVGSGATVPNISAVAGRSSTAPMMGEDPTTGKIWAQLNLPTSVVLSLLALVGLVAVARRDVGQRKRGSPSPLMGAVLWATRRFQTRIFSQFGRKIIHEPSKRNSTYERKA
jgi:hypothetical protein